MTKAVLTAITLAAFAAPALAQNTSYQPLTVGDTRSYHNSSAFGATQQISTEIQRQSGIWSRFDNYLNIRDQWVTLHRDKVYVYDSAVGQVVMLFDFTAPVGASWPVDFSRQFGAGASMTLAANDETVVVGAGTFRDCYRFTFQTPPGVADAGWGSIWFAPGVGVVKWSQNSFAGGVSYDLVTASIGGVTYPQPVATGGLSVTLEMDKFEYEFPRLAPVANIYATATLTVTNATGVPIDVTYGSGQTFDIVLSDSTGNPVWVWSSNKSFIQIVHTDQISGTFTLRDSIPLPAADEDYTVNMFLTTLGTGIGATAPIRVRVR